jgi:hypothetical protein
MEFTRRIINKIISNELPKQLGRWKIEYCTTTMNRKIDLSNEDHCGSCGQYAISKLESNDAAKQKIGDIMNYCTDPK